MFRIAFDQVNLIKGDTLQSYTKLGMSGNWWEVLKGLGNTVVKMLCVCLYCGKCGIGRERKKGRLSAAGGSPWVLALETTGQGWDRKREQCLSEGISDFETVGF